MTLAIKLLLRSFLGWDEKILGMYLLQNFFCAGSQWFQKSRTYG